MESETIVTCDCGARVRLPSDRDNRSFRCPACKRAIAVPVDARVLSATHLSPGEPGSLCPICQSNIGTEDVVVRCPECDQVHHNECWSEIGGCGTYGCTQAPVVEKTVAPVTKTTWGDKKNCPVCNKEIKSIALRCRHCDADFDTTDPMTRAEYRQRKRIAAELSSIKAAAVILFVLCLPGVTAPFAGLVASGYLLPKRELVRKCGPLFSFLTWTTLIVSGLLTSLVAAFMIVDWN